MAIPFLKSGIISLIVILCATSSGYAQSGSSYSDTSVDSDGVTVYGYTVGDFSMPGGQCNHTYSVAFDFYDSNYNLVGNNDGITSETAPANQYTEVRHDDAVVTDDTSVYYYAAPGVGILPVYRPHFL